MEEGLYVARIIGQRINESAVKRTAYAALHVEIVGRVNLMNPTDPPAKVPAVRRTVDLWLTDAAAERSIRDLRAIGWTGSKFTEFDDRIEGHVNITGRSIFVSCRIDDAATPVRERWAITSAPQAVDTSRLVNLDARFGSLLTDTIGTTDEQAGHVGDESGPNEPAG